MNPNFFQFRQSRGRWSAIIFLACTLATSFFLFRPGIAMSDTLARWAAVFTIAGDINIGWSMEQWLAPTMAIFMIPIRLLHLPTEFFTLLQLVYLMLAGSAWIALTSSRRPFWIPLTFLLPLVFIYTSFVVPDVWTLAAIILVAGSICAIEHGWRWTPIVIFLISCTVLFGFRTNSLVLLPVVFAMILTSKLMRYRMKGLLLGLIIIANALIFVTPGWLGFEDRTSTAAAPAWELIGMLRIARETQTPVDSTLSLDGIVNTNVAIKAHSFTTIDTLLWGADAALPTGVILNNSNEIKTRWLHTIIAHPALYFNMKINTYKCMLGLCEDFLQTQLGLIDVFPILDGRVSIYNSHPRGISVVIFQLGNRMGQSLKAILVPIFWLPITLFVFLLNWKTYGRYDRWLILMTSAYLGSFFVLNQAASFRYMFPVYVIFTAYQFRFIGWLISKIQPTLHLFRAKK